MRTYFRPTVSTLLYERAAMICLAAAADEVSAARYGKITGEGLAAGDGSWFIGGQFSGFLSVPIIFHGFSP